MVAIATVGSVSPQIAVNTAVTLDELLDFVLDVPEAVESLVDYCRSISGEHPDWGECRHPARLA